MHTNVYDLFSVLSTGVIMYFVSFGDNYSQKNWPILWSWIRDFGQVHVWKNMAERWFEKVFKNLQANIGVSVT